MSVYFNEIDKYPAKWLGNLFPDAFVDARSIKDVRPADTTEYLRCHFFAGIGGWEYALQLAGWPADREVWTGSCPCQPFSQAGKRKGKEDERHLWPDFLRLIAERRPSTIFGEQVASADGREWLAGVRSDLEALGYEVGSADLCAASIGAPHIRQRLYWGACRLRDTNRITTSAGSMEARHSMVETKPRSTGSAGAINLALGRLSDASGERRQQDACSTSGNERADGRWTQGDYIVAGITQNPWGNIAVLCADGKARRAEPFIRPLAHGLSRRVEQCRAYGNAIVPQVAAKFIEAFLMAEAEI